jgi:hypothetical protein
MSTSKMKTKMASILTLLAEGVKQSVGTVLVRNKENLL